MKLSQKEKVVLRKVFNEMLKSNNLFCGCYDAKNGNASFMHGISTVMEYLAYSIDDNLGDEFSEIFINNMLNSSKKT